jgi:hypothetical protein
MGDKSDNTFILVVFLALKKSQLQLGNQISKRWWKAVIGSPM